MQEYRERKAAGDFEVRRPKTTKEIAVHNNQLLQELPGQMMQAMLQAQQGKQPAAWCEAFQERPTAPRPTADEQEEQAEEQRQELLRRVQELQEGGAGAMAAWRRMCCRSAAGKTTTSACKSLLLVGSSYRRSHVMIRLCTQFARCKEGCRRQHQDRVLLVA